MEFSFSLKYFNSLKSKVAHISLERVVLVLAIVLSCIGIAYAYSNDVIVAYGDAESHLNIAKRVPHSLTPGMAQLGGIWLPLPHLMMIPFIYFDFLWRTGLGGAFVSGFSYVISCLYLYRISVLLTKKKLTGFVAFLLFALNLNVLYMQATPMTELPLLMFFMLSNYYFVKYLQHPRRIGDSLLDIEDVRNLVLTAFFTFCATLSRYDGWFLVIAQAGSLALIHMPWKNWTWKLWHELEGKLVMFMSLAFLGVVLWLLWDWLILGDPLYFTNSQFSAKSQQQGWLAKGELPTYHNLPLSVAYYTVTSMATVGVIAFGMSLLGVFQFIRDQFKSLTRWLVVGNILIPYFFYVITMFIGQSVIFIPHLTPVDFEWRLFNVRYGLMMVPAVALFAAYYITRLDWKWSRGLVISLLLLMQVGMYFGGYSRVISYDDGVTGLSAARRTDAETWFKENYDGGLVLIDDFARTVSVVRSGVPMQNIIYVGNKPYWEESLENPEKYADWIVIQENDSVWTEIYSDEAKQGRLFAHFSKAYTSEEILIFVKSDKIAGNDTISFVEEE